MFSCFSFLPLDAISSIFMGFAANSIFPNLKFEYICARASKSYPFFVFLVIHPTIKVPQSLLTPLRTYSYSNNVCVEKDALHLGPKVTRRLDHTQTKKEFAHDTNEILRTLELQTSNNFLLMLFIKF
jgi:hypothetical protein